MKRLLDTRHNKEDVGEDLWLLKIGGHSFAGFNATNYGLHKLFNEWYHTGKTKWIGDEDNTFELIDIQHLIFSTQDDLDKTILAIGFVSELLDFESFKKVDVFIFTKDDIKTKKKTPH